MVNIITRSVGTTAKGSPLTNVELDNNFINLKNAIESGLSTTQINAAVALLNGNFSGITPADLEFSNSKLRGMSVDDVGAVPRDQNYWDLLSRFNANVVRTFIRPNAASFGSAYTLLSSHYTSMDTDIAAAWAIGIKTIIAVQSTTASNILDAQSHDFLTNTSAKTQYATFIGSLGQRYAGDERIAAIDIINEPFDATVGVTQIGSDNIMALQEECIAAIRLYDLNRICIVECTGHDSPVGFTFLKPVADKNVVYSVHVYQPFGVTHSNVAAPLYTGLWPTATPVDGGFSWLNAQIGNRERLKQELKPVIDFQNRYGVNIFVGEFSCSRMTHHTVAPAYVEDAINVFEELGWSWNYHSFGFPSVPWGPFEMPFSSALISYNNTVTSGTVALNTTTGNPGNSSRTPIAPVSSAFSKNKLHRNAPVPPQVAFFAGEDFELASSGRSWTSLNGVTGAGVVNTAATSFPKSGTKHALFTHADTGDAAAAYILMSDQTGAQGEGELFLSFDVRLGATITSSKTLQLLQAFGQGGSNPYLTLANVSGTNTWQLDVWKGSGDYGARQFYLVNGLSLPVGVYTRLKLAWIADQYIGRIRVWQDDILLVDINTTPTITNNATDGLWRPQLGLLNSNQRLQNLAFDNILFSRGSDIC